MFQVIFLALLLLFRGLPQPSTPRQAIRYLASPQIQQSLIVVSATSAVAVFGYNTPSISSWITSLPWIHGSPPTHDSHNTTVVSPSLHSEAIPGLAVPLSVDEGYKEGERVIGLSSVVTSDPPYIVSIKSSEYDEVTFRDSYGFMIRPNNRITFDLGLGHSVREEEEVEEEATPALGLKTEGQSSDLELSCHVREQDCPLAVVDSSSPIETPCLGNNDQKDPTIPASHNKEAIPPQAQELKTEGPTSDLELSCQVREQDCQLVVVDSSFVMVNDWRIKSAFHLSSIVILDSPPVADGYSSLTIFTSIVLFFILAIAVLYISQRGALKEYESERNREIAEQYGKTAARRVPWNFEDDYWRNCPQYNINIALRNFYHYKHGYD